MPAPAIRLPRWIAHRGGGALAPENTLAGLRAAARCGLHAVEFDVMLSADGVPVLIHDETLERTTNGVGRVAETPYARLATLDAGAGEVIPTLRQAAHVCRTLGLWANIEIKPASGYEQETGAVVAALAAELWMRASQPPLLSSFSDVALRAALTHAPQLPRGWLCSEPPDDWLVHCQSLQAASLHCSIDGATPQLIAAAQAAQVPVAVFTVNTAATAKRLLAAGVSALFTDHLDLARNF